MIHTVSKLSDAKYDMQMKMVDYLRKDGYQVTRTLDGIPIDYYGAWELQPRTHELFNGFSIEFNFTPTSGWDDEDLHRCMEEQIAAHEEAMK